MKKISILLLSLLFTAFLGTGIVAASNKANKLRIYYYRYDNNYDEFNVWLWEKEPQSRDGKRIDFTNEQVDPKYGAYIEVDLTDEYKDATRFGLIIRKGDWGGYREPGGDRFLEVSEMELKNNTISAYIVEQDLNIGMSQDDLDNNIPNYAAKVLSASFDINYNIKARSSHAFEKYNIYENGKTIKTGTSDTTSISVGISNMSLQNKYTVEFVYEDNKTAEKIVDIEKLYDTDAFIKEFSYDGDLGVIYNENKSIFRLWAPISDDVKLNLYKQGHPNYNSKGEKSDELKPYETIEMEYINNGVWEATVNKDLANTYYTFDVTNYGIANEVTDPYSYSTGANGLRSMVVDFEGTNPENWVKNNRPDNVKNYTDYIPYELHVRDLTVHESWNGSEENRGKFLGFTEQGTTYTKDGITVSTGLDHLTELGVNAVQLLPIFDFGYLDEVEMALNPDYDNTFNWGYMPYHFNTLEGTYSTNPFDGASRINEFKQLVAALHENDMRVIMDVVYNHTGESETSNFHKIIPGYYHRMNDEGGFSNGSGTGNETASERSMVRKFMVDSLKFLTTEYNLSGFRFDLMALHDVDTMQLIAEELHKIDPTIIIYGEPWDAGGAKLDPKLAAGKDNLKDIDNVGAFNDATRDAIKGSVFVESEGAWLQGENSNNHVENIKYGIAGGVNHDQVSANKWHLDPNKTINYVSAHDNNTLHDKLRLTGVKNDITLEKKQIQANAMILTSQGVPFLHAGVEFMRSKPTDTGYDENSYQSPDSVNQLRWDRKATYIDVFEYYQSLIAIRKAYPQFRMSKAEDIQKYLRFDINSNSDVISFKINIPNMPEVIVEIGRAHV